MDKKQFLTNFLEWIDKKKIFFVHEIGTNEINQFIKHDNNSKKANKKVRAQNPGDHRSR
jgi:hypothetical protein